MELVESICWIAVGFIPTIVSMELAFKVATKRTKLHNEKRLEIERRPSGLV